eukprot:13609608-Heterocapsa_arctica.AAC.1
MFEDGDLVEFHRPPMSKDDSGWRGPATAVSMEGGTITVRWRGRFSSWTSASYATRSTWTG